MGKKHDLALGLLALMEQFNNLIDAGNELNSIAWEAKRANAEPINTNECWQQIYDHIFGSLDRTVRPALKVLGITIDYADPDTTYEEDVKAFVNAFNEKKDRLKEIASTP